jgi:hypothetical protein
MADARKTEHAAATLGEAISRLKRDGGPVPVSQDGKTVAVMLTPAELEQLEDERDAALLRAAMVRPDDDGRIGLDDLAAELGLSPGQD